MNFTTTKSKDNRIKRKYYSLFLIFLLVISIGVAYVAWNFIAEPWQKNVNMSQAIYYGYADYYLYYLFGNQQLEIDTLLIYYLGQKNRINTNPQISEYDYIVGVNGSSYYALSGETGTVAYSETNASEVIQNCIDLNASIYIKAGNYTLQNGLDYSGKHGQLIGSGFTSTILYYDGSEDIIKINETTNHVGTSIKIANIFLQGNDSTTNGNGITIINHMYVVCEDVKITDCHFGVYLSASAFENKFYHNIITDCNTGVMIYNNDTTFANTDKNFFVDCWIQDNKYQINITGHCDGNIFDNCFISGYYSPFVEISTSDGGGVPDFNIIRNCWLETPQTGDDNMTLISIKSYRLRWANQTTSATLITGCNFHTNRNVTYIDVESGWITRIIGNWFKNSGNSSNTGRIWLRAPVGNNYGSDETLIVDNVGYTLSVNPATLTIVDDGVGTVQENNINFV